MKFKIRYADQLVGLFVLVALLSLVTLLFLLGRTQRWFSRNYTYVSYAESASGISQNMQVHCRGIPIGNVKSFQLTGDNKVEVFFTIQDEYQNRIKQGSLVEVLVNPIGLGSQFILYPGLGAEDLEEFALVPMVDSPEGKDYIARGMASKPAYEDSITVLLAKAQAVLDDLDQALKLGVDEEAVTSLGRIIVNVRTLTSNLASDMADPRGIRRILNGEGDTIRSLEASMVSLAGTLDHVEKATAYIPREMPQIINLLTEARTALQAAEDVLIALRNNPLLKGGIPEHAEIDASGTNPRNITF